MPRRRRNVAGCATGAPRRASYWPTWRRPGGIQQSRRCNRQWAGAQRQAPQSARVGAPGATDQRTPIGLERQVLDSLLDRLRLVMRVLARVLVHHILGAHYGLEAL